jgi:hypothetical protein
VRGAKTPIFQKGFCDSAPADSQEAQLVDDVQKSDLVVWGIPVPVTPRGALIWPAEIKKMALAKLADGAGPIEVARELGATQSLSCKWSGATKNEADAPALVELMHPALSHQRPESGQTGHTSSLRLAAGRSRIRYPA